MKEAVGGVFSIQALLVFIVLALGLLLFSVNYAKAFRVKNEIRRVIEQYEGLTEGTKDKLDNIAQKYGYAFKEPDIYVNACRQAGFTAYRDGNFVFCYKCKLSNEIGNDEGKIQYRGAYYTVATFVNLDIPLINRIFPKTASFLRVEGETALIYSSGNNSEVCTR